MLTTITALAGLFFGLCGFTLGVLNYRRDRARVLLSLDWHGCIIRQTDDLQAKLGRIYLTNTGRRPVYIVSVGLLFFTLSEFQITRTTFGHVKGFRLSEGDPPVSLVVPDSVEMAKFLWVDHKEHWLYLRAFAYDSTGRRYLSGKPKRRPFWGGSETVKSEWRSQSQYPACHTSAA
jgi:hypothetical protein